MAADGVIDSEGFVGALSDAFHRSLFQPMFQRAPLAPSDVRQLIAEFRRKLDLLDEVIATAEPGAAPLVFRSRADMVRNRAQGATPQDCGREKKQRQGHPQCRHVGGDECDAPCTGQHRQCKDERLTSAKTAVCHDPLPVFCSRAEPDPS